MKVTTTRVLVVAICAGALGLLASLWLGNRTRIAAHYDLPDNLAVVAAGRRRFTVFPPTTPPGTGLPTCPRAAGCSGR